MLGKRTRPTMRRTTSMSQLGLDSNIEEISPVRENDVVKEKQKIPISIAPHLRPPTSGSSGISAPSRRNFPVKQTMNCVMVNPDQAAFGDGALAEGMGMVYPTQGYDTVHEHFHHPYAHGQGQFQTFSGHSGLQSCVPVGSSSTMGMANGVRGDRSLHGTETIPSSPGRSYGVQMVEPSHFLQACFLCKRRLGHGRDIYMYKDDRAFCSVECREQQILLDERKEKRSVKIMTTGSLPSDLYQSIGMNSQSGRAKNIQSERRAAA